MVFDRVVFVKIKIIYFLVVKIIGLEFFGLENNSDHKVINM